jgi:hypothetical protein
METYKFVVTLEVEVKAYNPMDATEMVEDAFGPGEDCGVEVKKLTVKEAK